MNEEFNFLHPENVWRNNASQFLDVVDNKNGQNGSSIREAILYPKLIEHMGDVAGKLLLDSGCGEGAIGRLAIERGASVIGVDVVPEFVKEAFLRSNGELQPVLANLRYGLPFSSASFDLVCYNLVLMWLPEITKVIEETERVLKPDGKIVVSLLHPWTALTNKNPTDSEKPTLNINEGMRQEVIMRTINKTAGPYPYFHRSIAQYLDTFAQNGLHLDPNEGFDEVPAASESDTPLVEWIIPEFLILTFRKSSY